MIAVIFLAFTLNIGVNLLFVKEITESYEIPEVRRRIYDIYSQEKKKNIQK
ncbi:MAG TPA: hypothetical protein VKN74_06165 [Candidatus Mcinerneyibacterium sp.]|nr:hypothetical protein [Candidatus Mcinerneyibacterium sp.]